MTAAFRTEFIEQSVYKLEENTGKISKCLHELEEAEIWKRPNEVSNSMGNQILHLCGNIRQYVISALGGKKDVRERDKEFSVDGGYSKTELLGMLTATIEEAKSIIQQLDADKLLEKRPVQGFRYSGIGNIIHVVEHYSYHCGQIAFWTKILKNKDLGFYAGMDLNARNEL